MIMGSSWFKKTEERPIIFVAHSLGGIVLKIVSLQKVVYPPSIYTKESNVQLGGSGACSSSHQGESISSQGCRVIYIWYHFPWNSPGLKVQNLPLFLIFLGLVPVLIVT